MSLQPKLCDQVNPIHKLLCSKEANHDGLCECYTKDGTRYKWNRLMTITVPAEATSHAPTGGQ